MQLSSLAQGSHTPDVVAVRGSLTHLWPKSVSVQDSQPSSTHVLDCVSIAKSDLYASKY